jgi:SH3 domain protein
MSRFSFLVALTVAACALAPAGVAQADKAYTVNTDPLPLRATPSPRGKAVAMLPPSSTVERVSDRSNTRVIYRTPDGTVKEGWIPSRFLSAVPVDSSPFKKLSAENEALKAQVAQLQNDSTGLSQKEKDLTDKLSTLTAAYDELKKGSVNYLKLKAEYDSAKTGLDSARKSMQSLVRENEDLKLYHNIQWFLAGGVVLLLGWFMGWSSTRWRKKRKQSYYL